MIKAICNGTALELQGHAGAAPYGQDLVCAAVSALVYALAQRLTELEEQGALEEPPEITLASGNARISAIAKSDYETEVNGDFRLIYSGLKLLQTHYPEGIQIRDMGYEIRDTRYKIQDTRYKIQDTRYLPTDSSINCDLKYTNHQYGGASLNSNLSF